MNNNKRFLIGALAAMFTFGGLKAFVDSHHYGRHHRPHWGHHDRGCKPWGHDRHEWRGCGEHKEFREVEPLHP